MSFDINKTSDIGLYDVFEGMTSISAVIKSVTEKISDRKIIKIIICFSNGKLCTVFSFQSNFPVLLFNKSISVLIPFVSY